jgi:hypothetical protein
MAGLGRKTFSSGEVLTAANVQGYLMDQAVMVFDGTASRGSAIPTPSAGMVAYSTATQLQVYDGSAWVDLSTGYGVATGGSSSSITVGGVNYTLLSFTSDSTLTVTKSGLFDLLVISGGGGGGKDATGSGGDRGGGGGGGGVVELTGVYFSANQTVTVGAGGAAGATSSSNGSPGAPSRVGDFYALGGGGGGYSSGIDPITIDSAGGSMGGGTKNANFNSITQGNKGGIGATPDAGAGGGGKGAVGGDGSGTTGGNGGAGTDVSTFIAGSALFKAAGGGGAGSVTGGAGGSSIGGNGSSGATPATSATANTASGGGGSKDGVASGNGGSGIVYVRFKV